MDFKSTNPLGIIGIIGAVILVAGVFLAWITVDLGMLGSSTRTGWEVFNDWSENGHYTPVFCLAVGVLSILLMILPSIMNVEKFQMINNVLGLITVILSIVTVVIMILFYTQDYYGLKMTTVFEFGVGYWLCLVGSVITMIGGVMPIVKNKLL